MVNFSLEGKVALVTGASYGIGFALATAFAQAGAKIVFNDIKQELVDKGLAAYKAEGIDAKGYVCDVTNEEQVNAMVAQIEKEGMAPGFRGQSTRKPAGPTMYSCSTRGEKDFFDTLRDPHRGSL